MNWLFSGPTEQGARVGPVGLPIFTCMSKTFTQPFDTVHVHVEMLILLCMCAIPRHYLLGSISLTREDGHRAEYVEIMGWQPVLGLFRGQGANCMCREYGSSI